MNFIKTMAAVSAIAISSFSVNAEQLSVGGITWDSSYETGASLFDDFFAGASYNETLTDSGELSGEGVVGFVNGTDADVFCVVAGCTLSYTFEGFNVDPISNTVTSTGATLDFTVTDALGNESTWLSLAATGSAIYGSGTSFSAVTNTFTVLFDVVEVVGTAWKNFDTDTQLQDSDFIMIGTSTGGVDLSAEGAVFKSTSVPAPAMLAIFGLALLGLARRRKA